MKISSTLFLLLAGALPAPAALVTLTSPDGLWRLSSDEFGAYGEGSTGSFAQRNFGSGLTGYAWQAATLLTDGANVQWLAGAPLFGDAGYGGAPLGGANLISDTTVAGTRTSVFSAGGVFSSLRITLTQSALNSGLQQQYSISNTGGSAANFSLISFHDVDLDAITFLNDTVSAAPGYVAVSEGGRNVYFSAGGTGYAGFLSGHLGVSGITGTLNVLAQNNFGIPAGNLNQFRDVTGGAIGADFDTDLNQISDTPSDVGYLIHHNLTLQSGASATVGFVHSAVPIPEPASLSLFGAAALLVLRRRRG